MKRVLFILVGLALIIGLAGASCAPISPTSQPTPTAGKGMLEVVVTDAPPKEQITSIMVTVSKVEVHRAVAEQEQQQTQGGDSQVKEQQQVQQGKGEWLNISIPDSARTFDLLKVKGIEKVLTTNEVEAGKYTQVRLTVEKIEVALGDGVLKPATVPSGELKFIHPVDIVAGEKTTIVVDFDADKSVNIAGKDKILVKPVVKLIVKQAGSTTPGTATRVVTQEESQKIAEDFVQNEPTFVFDGMTETLKLVETRTLLTPYGWEFIYEFQSRHAGYGDRTGQVLAQVITPHKAAVTVIQGEITRAVMDEKWDMLKQQEIGSSQAGKSEAIFVNEKNDGKEVQIGAGGLLTVSLESNR